MHAVLITFTSSHALPALTRPFTEYAQALCSVPGLFAKTWLANGSELGGFHLFDSPEAADRYLEGPLFATVREDAAFTDVRVRRFDVLEPLSAITNGLASGPLAAAAVDAHT
jgi:hypothetical protein